jgi:hypothetical protein
MEKTISMDHQPGRSQHAPKAQLARLPAIQTTGLWMAMAFSAWGLITVALLAVL